MWFTLGENSDVGLYGSYTEKHVHKMLWILLIIHLKFGTTYILQYVILFKTVLFIGPDKLYCLIKASTHIAAPKPDI